MKTTARAYTVPTERPESDGTLEWDETTIVVVEIEADGGRGLGYTYSHAAAAQVVGTVLAPLLEGAARRAARRQARRRPPGACEDGRLMRSRVGVEELLAAAREEIWRLTPAEALATVADGALLIDIRQAHQRDADGLVPGAHVVERNVLEWRLDPRGAHRDPRLARTDVPVILICHEGYQSSLAAALLCRLGLDAGDVIGGVQEWKQEALPLEVGTPTV